jgi:hypothetical protein
MQHATEKQQQLLPMCQRICNLNARPLALQAQILQSITGHKIPVSNLSDSTSKTTLVYLITIIDNGSASEEVPQIPNSWHTSLCRTATTALATLRQRVAGPLQPLEAATAHPFTSWVCQHNKLLLWAATSAAKTATEGRMMDCLNNILTPATVLPKKSPFL